MVMRLTEMEASRIRRLLWEIDRETRGRGREIYITNKLNDIRKILRKGDRREKRINES